MNPPSDLHFIPLPHTPITSIPVHSTITLRSYYNYITKWVPIIDVFTLQEGELNSRIITQPPPSPDPRTLTPPSSLLTLISTAPWELSTSL